MSDSGFVKPFFKSLPGAVLVTVVVLAIVTLLGMALTGTGIFFRDIEREVVQHSRQYTETKTGILQSLHSDWLALESEIKALSGDPGNQSIVDAKRSQQKAIVRQMRSEADLIPESEVPRSVVDFLGSH